jgi:hypothetical protein
MEMTLKAGPELDALVGSAMGHSPAKLWMISSDGGKSGCMFFGGGASAEGDAKHWLGLKQRKNLYLEYRAVSIDRWAEYSTDAKESQVAKNWLLDQGWDLSIVMCKDRTGTGKLEVIVYAVKPNPEGAALTDHVHGETEAEAIALLVLAVAGIDA